MLLAMILAFAGQGCSDPTAPPKSGVRRPHRLGPSPVLRGLRALFITTAVGTAIAEGLGGQDGRSGGVRTTLRPVVSYADDISVGLEGEVGWVSRFSVVGSLMRWSTDQITIIDGPPDGWSLGAGVRVAQAPASTWRRFAQAEVGVHRFGRYPRTSDVAPFVAVGLGVARRIASGLVAEVGLQLQVVSGYHKNVPLNPPRDLTMVRRSFSPELLPGLRLSLGFLVD